MGNKLWCKDRLNPFHTLSQSLSPELRGPLWGDLGTQGNRDNEVLLCLRMFSLDPCANPTHHVSLAHIMLRPKRSCPCWGYKQAFAHLPETRYGGDKEGRVWRKSTLWMENLWVPFSRTICFATGWSEICRHLELKLSPLPPLERGPERNHACRYLLTKETSEKKKLLKSCKGYRRTRFRWEER